MFYAHPGEFYVEIFAQHKEHIGVYHGNKNVLIHCKLLCYHSW